MWPFTKAKRHLRYDSISGWIAGENVPLDFIHHPDLAERDKYLTQYGELRRHLFDKHIKTLSNAEQELFKLGRHPSQSHEFAAAAKSYTEKLRIHLQQLDCHVIDVCVGFYHCDRIVLSVDLADSDADKLQSLPWLFAGFEIKYALKNLLDE
ncbi:MAG: hypothetical protein KDA78_15830 [Planctomycetaceae bacterium]|nr:hypothetical protein [Planctomycetaceae bacterium]